MLAGVGVFLVSTIFNVYVYILMLRLVLQAVGARYDTPLPQFALRFTQPIVKPLQRVVPQFGRIDLAVVLLAFLVECVKYILILTLVLGEFPHVFGLLLSSAGDLFRIVCSFYFYLIIARVILSWLTPSHHNPFFFLVTQMTEPLLYPVRRVVPLLGGFDLSPLMVLIILQVLEMIVAYPLMQWGGTFM